MTLHKATDLVTDEHGNWAIGAQVVFKRDGVAVPMWADADGTAQITEAVTGQDGRFTAWLAFGCYTLEATYRGVTRQVTDVWVGAQPPPGSDAESFAEFIRTSAAPEQSRLTADAGATLLPTKTGKQTVVDARNAPQALLLPAGCADGWQHTVVQQGDYPVLIDVATGASATVVGGAVPLQMRGDADVVRVTCTANNAQLTAAQFVLTRGG